MNTRIALFLTVIVMLSSCNKDDDTEPQAQQHQRDEISFTGKWQRQFEAGPGNPHTVDYIIYQDSIRYTLAGSVGNADYVMHRDTFLLENNRFIGHTSSNQHYLIFVKQKSNDSIALYKTEIADIAVGMAIEVPDDNTAANHGWNTYHKQ
jgi:hypothetical protein